MKRCLLSLATLCAAFAAVAQDVPPPGFLCCNMRTDGSWISDINYDENQKKVIAAGTPLKATGYGRYRVLVELDGGVRQAIGNDYSRNLAMDEFAKRYIVAQDPRARIAAFPARIKEAIQQARVMPGMTREQVLMSVGYPVTSENPVLDAPMWRFWLDSWSEFQVLFDAGGVVREITADDKTKNRVLMR
jgi:hypothetical protein